MDKMTSYSLRHAPSRSEKARDAANSPSKRKRSTKASQNDTLKFPSVTTALRPADNTNRTSKKARYSISSSQHSPQSDWHFDVVSGGAPPKATVERTASWAKEENDDDEELTAFVREWRPSPFTGVLCWQIAVLDEHNFSTPDYRTDHQRRTMLAKQRDGRDISPRRKPNHMEMNEVERLEVSRMADILVYAVDETDAA